MRVRERTYGRKFSANQVAEIINVRREGIARDVIVPMLGSSPITTMHWLPQRRLLLRHISMRKSIVDEVVPGTAQRSSGIQRGPFPISTPVNLTWMERFGIEMCGVNHDIFCCAISATGQVY